MLVQCTNCKKDIDEDSQYCAFCGVKISPKNKTIKCPSCLKEISEASKFCCYCGTKIIIEEPQKIQVKPLARNLKTCPNCKRDVTLTCEKCFYCGYNLTPDPIEPIKVSDRLIRCPMCGRDIVNTSEICSYCGYRIKPETEEQKRKKERKRILDSMGWLLYLPIIVIIGFFLIKTCNSTSEMDETVSNNYAESSPSQPLINPDGIKIFKFISTKNNLTDNNLNVTTYNQTSYLTFDFNQKIITVRIQKPSSNTYDTFTFRMISAEFVEGSLLGDVYKVYVNANLPNLEGIETFKFNKDLPFIWVDGPGGTITFVVKPL